MKNTTTGGDHQRRDSSPEAIDQRFKESLEAAAEFDREMAAVSPEQVRRRIGDLAANRAAWDFAYHGRVNLGESSNEPSQGGEGKLQRLTD